MASLSPAEAAALVVFVAIELGCTLAEQLARDLSMSALLLAVRWVDRIADGLDVVRRTLAQRRRRAVEGK